MGGVKGAEQDAWYVLEKDLERNVLVVGQSHGHPLLYRNALEAGTLDWCDGLPVRMSLRCIARIR